jgi:Ca2+-binding EF-hand superfamily protein
LIIDEPALVNKEIIKVFSQQVEIDLNVEKAKVKLTNHLDFSFDELIKLIDRHNKGYVTSSDLEGTLRDLHIPFHKDEVQLLIKHFTKDDKISYRQTKDLFVPITWKDRKRVADFKDEGYRIFSADTLNHLIELFKRSLKAQVMLEKVRNSLQSELKSQLFQVFHEIDREKTGTVSLNNLRNYLADGKLNYREGEVRLLYKRYAKSYHKEITYSDFLEELTPKLAH